VDVRDCHMSRQEGEETATVTSGRPKERGIREEAEGKEALGLSAFCL